MPDAPKTADGYLVYTGDHVWTSGWGKVKCRRVVEIDGNVLMLPRGSRMRGWFACETWMLKENAEAAFMEAMRNGQ